MSRLTLTSLDRSEITVGETAVEELAERLHAPLLRSGEDGYDDARRPFNGIHDKRPGLIARCTGAADVIRCVDFARARTASSPLCGAEDTTDRGWAAATAVC